MRFGVTCSPDGLVNSVSIAQDIHRNVVKWSQQTARGLGGEAEMRRDRVGSSSSALHRVYLGNFDLLERRDKVQAEAIKGMVSEVVVALTEEYERRGLPRHPKKPTARACVLALSLAERGVCTLKELQVVCGGFVYFCMFRRPPLFVP